MAEAEVNPLIVKTDGVVAVDALISVVMPAKAGIQ